MGSEEKTGRFVRLAEARVNKAIKNIRLIGNLSNKNNYAYDEKQIDRIFQVLNSELKIARRRFQEALSSSDNKFKL